MNPVHDQAFREGRLVMDTKQELVDEIDRLRNALKVLARAGETGMAPDYSEWLTFHNKVARIANEALSN